MRTKMKSPDPGVLPATGRGLMFSILLILLLPSVHKSQSTLNNNNNVQPRQSEQSEILLHKGSSKISLSSSLVLEPGSLLGFSFRTCHAGGQLVTQTQGQNSFKLSLTAAGQLQLEIQNGNLTRTETVGAGLSEGAWHTVRVGVAVGGARLCFSVDSDIECDPPSPGPSVLNTGDDNNVNVKRMDDMEAILTSLQLSGGQPLDVGLGVVGCIREGPSLRFTTGNIRTRDGVTNGCLLPDSCQGYDWTSLGDVNSSQDMCGATQCEHGGVCYPRRQVASGPPTASAVCVCPPPYTGPRCSGTKTRCDEVPCLHGGNCTDQEDGFICSCHNTGYSGTYCHIEDNSCAGLTCENGATCLDQPRSFLCDCAEGYTGRRCDSSLQPQPQPRNLDLCVSDPGYCRNGGTCVSAGVASCSCPPGYQGDRCEVVSQVDRCQGISCPTNSECMVSGETPVCTCSPGFSGQPETGCIQVDWCGSSPCKNNGVCSNNGTFFSCGCTPGFQGATCEQDVAECDTNPCLHEGTCSETPGSFLCTCTEGYSGKLCQDDVNECESNPCLRGNCINRDGGYECNCEPGWSGLNCDFNEDECRSQPCRNNATCIDQENGFSCSCLPGFDGEFCETNINECAGSPCRNGGTCVDGINSYTCQCTPRFMGTNCELEYNPCANQPCENEATCNRVREERSNNPDEDFSCSCVPGFEGTRCATNIDDCVGVQCPEPKQCFDGINNYTCSCRPGFTGELCDQDIDECAPEPCQNGGTCQNQEGRYTCTCPIGWEGDNCQQNIDECARTPDICNSGICVDNQGGFDCYCKPGYTGDRCQDEFDECLSLPCLNNGTCANLVNAYSCTCQPGFTGEVCQVNIDECESGPCQNGAECKDGINNYTCVCSAGYSGRNCEVNIDDCEPEPCLHGGTCVDGVDLYTCNCTNTGYTGDNCEQDIDECAVDPCLHNSTCINLVNDYNCTCWPGYQGKNCSVDIKECESGPCKNNATCFERSDVNLYNQDVAARLPTGIKDYFLEGFSYDNAAGYLCNCPKGFEGANCEIDINECEGDPCQNGATCTDGIDEYTCLCKAGYTGENCEEEINECEVYQPCQNQARCVDKIADYECICEANFGGKNCSVPLTGCQDVTCLNGGTCTPYLVGESDHRQNCSCTEGYDGELCEIQTTFSFKGESSHITVKTGRSEGYELSFRFRTTLSNGVVAVGQGESFFTLMLEDGKLKVHSSMLQEFEGVSIGDNLNDTKWQQVYVAFNTSHLIMGLNNIYTRTHAINADNATHTAFNMTYLAGLPVNSKSIVLVKSPYEEFIGCIQDISVNGIKVTERVLREGELGITQNNTEKGCIRTEQCSPNPCMNDGQCKDLWRSKKCICNRPYLGPNCEYNYTGATFGHENTTNSQAVVTIDNPNDYKFNVDLSMFIRTRKATGMVFYLGKRELNSTLKNYIIGRLANGTLHVDISMNDLDQRDPLKIYSVQLSDGNRHFIRIKWKDNRIQVSVNESVYINQDLPITAPIQAEKLYLGNLNIEEPVVSTTQRPTTTTTTTASTTTTTTSVTSSSSSSSTTTTTAAVAATTTLIDTTIFETTEETLADEETVPEDITTAISSPIISRSKRDFDDDINDFFKGVIQDVRLGDGKTTKIVNFYELDVIADESALGVVQVNNVKEGEVSDDNCKEDPCKNGGQCHVTWNDYFCKCKDGYKGVNCDEKEYCYWNTCPDNSQCNTLKDGHECVSNVTLNGVNNSLSYTPEISQEVQIKSISLKFRTQSNGTVMQLVKQDGNGQNRIDFNVNDGSFEIVVRSGGREVENFTFGHHLNDGAWHTAVIKTIEGSLLGIFDNEDDEELLKTESVFNNLDSYVKNSEIIIGSSRQDSLFSNHFRGCLSELRMANILLPYFTDTELVNVTTKDRFVLQSEDSMPRGDCVLCYQEECRNDGVCANPADEFDCSCSTGFSGPTCAIDIDECLDNSCVHGVCVDGIGNYTCSCYQGWTGWLCDEDKDECEDTPCQNGGLCSQTITPGDYNCDCPSEYKGKNCEEFRIRTCDQTPCENGGSCIDQIKPGSSDQYRCDCAQGYTGSNCENQINYCQKLLVECKNGGTCRSDFTSFSYNCICKPGYVGKHCEIDNDDCASSPCQHSGVCTDLVDNYTCDCQNTGFNGRNCQENIDECAVEAPCVHGRCNDTVGDYQCHCDDTFCGKNCSRKNPCLQNATLCKNEGRCEPACDTDPGYQCMCSAGWEGLNCHLKVLHIPEPRDEGLDDELTSLIIAPVAGGMLFVALVGLVVFFNMARKKRSQHGTYNPQKQEIMAPRMELNYMLKPPIEERLI